MAVFLCSNSTCLYQPVAEEHIKRVIALLLIGLLIGMTLSFFSNAMSVQNSLYRPTCLCYEEDLSRMKTSYCDHNFKGN